MCFLGAVKMRLVGICGQIDYWDVVLFLDFMSSINAVHFTFQHNVQQHDVWLVYVYMGNGFLAARQNSCNLIAQIAEL